MTSPNMPPKKYMGGYLFCKTCQRAVPYTGLVEGPNDNVGDWPKHRCGRDIKTFDLWTKDNPQPRLPPPSAALLAAMQKGLPKHLRHEKAS